MSRDRIFVSTKQVSILVADLENNPSLLNFRRRCLNRFGKLVFQEEWEVLTMKLNSVPGGAQKSVFKWQQKWKNILYKLKKKTNQIKSGEAVPLTDMEYRILKIVNTKQSTMNDNLRLNKDISVKPEEPKSGSLHKDVELENPTYVN